MTLLHPFCLRQSVPVLIMAGLVAGIANGLFAQGQLADYQRSETLKNQLKDKVYNVPTNVNWVPNGHRVWYLTQTKRGKEFVLVDARKHTRQLAFDQTQLARKLSQATGKKIDPFGLPFTSITFGKDSSNIEFITEGTVWQFGPDSTSFRKKGTVPNESANRRYWGASRDERGEKPVFSPDSNWTAYIKTYNVYLRSRKTEEETPLSFDGSATNYYAGGLQWSPDSKKISTHKVRPGQNHPIYFVRSSPTDQLQPRLESRDYLKPGDTLPTRSPQTFFIDSRRQVSVDTAGLGNQYNLTRPEWRKDSRTFTIEYNQRGHQVYRVLEVDAMTGAVKTLVDERSPTFIDYSGKRYRYDMANGRELIWASERDDWNHLYLYDTRTGAIKSQITNGEWVVRNVMVVDENKRTIVFAASGKVPGQDPYFVQYYRINFDGTGLTTLTTEDANHTATFSPDYQYFVDTYSRVDLPPITVLRRSSDGSVVMELETADVTEWQKTGWKAPDVFTAKGRDGKTDIWGIIVRPTNFDPARTYPVIENIYAGPHSSFVPKTFMANNRSMFELAELGFVVVQIDGMGTSNRGKAFHDICWKNLKDAGFPDRILWMKAAAKKYAFMDLSRVGIYGTSAGGQSSTGGLLFHPDFYKVGVSSCGCHDNRMDKMWWNEQWMGYPIGPHYAECSNVVNAHKLQGKLLLMVGEVDDNVDPASTFQVADALIKANKDFELVVLPGLSHTSGGDFGEHKRRDFFVRHLLNTEPPVWSSLAQPASSTGSGK